MPGDILSHLPQQWVGLAAIIMFGVYVSLQVIEKSDKIAKVFPLGTWWHERQKARTKPAGDDSAAVVALERRVTSIARTSAKQAEDIASLQTAVSAFTAWSVFDARWHHRVAIENAERDACVLPKHYDFFDFERIWRKDPLAAARLSEA